MNRTVWAIVGALALAALAFTLGRSSGGAQSPFVAPQAASASTSTAPSGAGDTASASAATGHAARAPAVAGGVTPVPAAVASIAAAPLPPPDVPLADVLPELEQRARAGDANASCRIGLELHRCRRRALARPNERLQTDWFAR